MHPFDNLWSLKREHEDWMAHQGLLEKNRLSWSGLLFFSGGFQWAVSLTEVNEIVPFLSITPVPNVKKWMKGIINLRGNLLAVTDLSEFLGGQPTKISRNCRVLIFLEDEEWVGILVDMVMTLVRVAAADLKPAQDEEIGQSFIEQRLMVRGMNIPILKLSAIIRDPSFSQVVSNETGIR